MKIDGATTDDAEPTRAAEPGIPTLLLLYSGHAVLAEPQRIVLRPGTTVIGRAAEEANGVCLDDKRASRVHAIIQHEARSGQLRVADAGSRNGTTVNGVRVNQAALHDGDLLRIGDSFLLMRNQPASPVDAPVGRLLGVSAVAAHLRSSLARVAPTNASVLLLGETGTGKEIAARYLHDLSARSGPFVAVNCSALPEALIESQLFGHTRGAFTGATPHTGFFRAAQKGTLLLDEIGELALTTQPKLLRILEERMVFPVGSVVGQPIDVRLIFATNRNLLTAVSTGKFRADLYSRIAEVVVELPPLRQRKEDIFLLLQNAAGVESLNIPPSLVETLLLHDWPFNVRELVKLATEMSASGDLAAIEARLRRGSDSPMPQAGAVQGAEVPVDEDAPGREQFVELLRTYHGNVAAIARTLKCPRKYIYRWIEQYSLDLNAYRE